MIEAMSWAKKANHLRDCVVISILVIKHLVEKRVYTCLRKVAEVLIKILTVVVKNIKN